MFEFLNWINEWAGLIMSLVVGVGFFCKPIRNWLRKKLIEPDERQDELIALFKEAILAILHDRIYALCHFYLERGYMETDECKNLEHLYEAYEALGGNGTGKKLRDRCMELPIRKEIKD